MSTKRTEHYGLHAWEAGDSFLREEFNENFTAVDGLLGKLERGKIRMVAGSYTGDGEFYQHIDLGAEPRMVMVTRYGRMHEGSYVYGGVAYAGAPGEGMVIGDGGFTVGTNSGNFVRINQRTSVYQYGAFYWED